MRVEEYVVPKISHVHNEHQEIVHKNYRHLVQIWLSDVCKSSDQLKIDFLIGVDYLWSFNILRTCSRLGQILKRLLLKLLSAN